MNVNIIERKLKKLNGLISIAQSKCVYLISLSAGMENDLRKIKNTQHDNGDKSLSDIDEKKIKALNRKLNKILSNDNFNFIKL